MVNPLWVGATGGVIFACLTAYLVCFLVWANRSNKRRHPRQHFKTLVLFPLVQVVGAAGLTVSLVVDSTVADKDSVVSLTLREAFIMGPLILFRFGLVLVVFFWNQLHYEYKNARFGKLFMPFFMRRTFFLTLLLALWIFLCMSICLETFQVDDFVSNVTFYLAYYPLMSIGVLIGLVRTFFVLTKDFRRMHSSYTAMETSYIVKIRGVCIVAIAVFALTLASTVLKEVFYELYRDDQKVQDFRHVLTILIFLLDCFSSVYISIKLFCSTPDDAVPLNHSFHSLPGHINIKGSLRSPVRVDPERDEDQL